MAKSTVGRVSGNERVDTSAMAEPDADTEAMRKLFLEDVKDDPDFKSEIAFRVDQWKKVIGMSMDPAKIDIHMCGESHIDVAWLWRYEQTRKKAAVTLRKALLHAKMFPGTFSYALSEPILLEWIKADDPDLFKEIQAEVKRGGIELVGGAYVEPDCMMPSGEAFTRQRLYGQRFYRDNFGILPEVEWFLDSFGYNWGLPQILAKSGAKYFWTSKITWNMVTRFPFVNFWWEGPDGSRILTANFHMGPGELDNWVFFEVGRRPLKQGGRKIWDYTMDYDELGDHVEENEICPVVGDFSGKGDGGHGPTHHEVAVMNEYASLKFMHWSKVHAFYRELARWSDRFPVWKDELYLENHQGTFSVHAEVKRHNRLFENALTAIETFSVLAAMSGKGFSYPAAKIEQAWKTVLKNQFHDVLPGSSIPEVYDDSMDDWDENVEIIESIKADIGKSLGSGDKMGEIEAKTKPVRSNDAADILLFNPVSWERVARVFIPATLLGTAVPLDKSGRPPLARLSLLAGSRQEVAAQPVAAEDPKGIDPRPAGWWSVVTLNGCSATPARITIVTRQGGMVEPASPFKATKTGIEGKAIAITIDPATGALTGLVARNINGGKDLLAGKASGLSLAFLDESKAWPAWNLTPQYWKFPIEMPNDKDVQIVVEDCGPVFCSVAIHRILGKSKVIQKIAMFDGCPEVFLEWIADWQQEKVMIKVPYTTATGATSVVADIAFGAIERSTVPVAPGDKARHEKICHKYIDLSTPGKEWGIAMLNEGKYAFDATGGTMRLTMLRSPEYPAPAGEAFVNKEREARLKKDGTAPPRYSGIGPFKCRYALLPHEGGALAGANGKPSAVVKRAAEEFNQPVVVVPVAAAVTGRGDSIVDGAAMLDIKPAHVMASAVKLNEWDANGNVIMRFLETSGFPADVTVSLHPAIAKRVKSARMVDLLERPTGAACTWDAAGGVLSFKVGKFEACTVELVLG